MAKNIIRTFVDTAIERKQSDFQSALQEGYKKGLLFDERANYFGNPSLKNTLEKEYLEYLEYLDIQRETTYRTVRNSAACYGFPVLIWIVAIIADIIASLGRGAGYLSIIPVTSLLLVTLIAVSISGWFSVMMTVNTLTPIYKNLGIKLGRLTVNTSEYQVQYFLESRAIKLEELRKYRVAS